MANSTAQGHSTTNRSTTSRTRKPLNAAKIYQAWSAECSMHGRRGALKRTADLVGVSPEYIRQLVAKHEAAHTLAPELFTKSELDYLPAPGEVKLVRPVQPRPTASIEASTCPTDDFDTYVKLGSELNVNSCERGESPQLATDTEAQPAERETVVLPVVEMTTAAPPTTALPSTLVGRSTVKRYAPRPAPRPAYADLLDVVHANVLTPGPVLALLIVAVAALLYLVAHS